jgi:hypothetical protein
MAAGVLLLAALARANAVQPIDDPAQLLHAPSAWTAAQADRVARFEAKTGVRILVECHVKSPPDDEDRVDGAYMTALSTRLGTVDHGVLMVYFADDGSWRVWIGNALTPVFVGKPGTAKSLTDSGEMHQAKEAYLDAAKARAEARFVSLHPALPLSEAVRHSPDYLRLWTEELIAGLEIKLASVRVSGK